MYVDEGKCAECGKKLFPEPYLDRFNTAAAPYFCSVECAEAVNRIDEDDLRRREFNDQDPETLYIEGKFFYRDGDGWSKALEILRAKHNEEESKRIERVKKEGERTKSQFIDEYNEKKARVERAQDEQRHEEILAGVKSELAHLAEFGHDILTHEPDEKNTRDVSEWRERLAKYEPPREGEEFATTTLIDCTPDPLEEIVWAYQHYADKAIRSRLRNHLGMSLSEPFTVHEEIRNLRKAKYPPRDWATLLFGDHPGGTWLLRQPFPICVPERIQMQHTMVCAATGSGKTTLLQSAVLKHLARPDPPALFVIDPKGEMVRRIKALDEFRPYDGRLFERLLILDATSEYPPPLNLFAAPPVSLPQKTRERMQNQIIDLLEYIFSSSDFKLTPKQSVGFSFLARLMFQIPDANLHTLLDVIDERVDFKKGEKSKFTRHIQKLDYTAQRFFETDFYGEFGETKSQIKSRIYMVLKSPELSRMFNARTCTMDWFSSLQEKDIVLVHTGLNQIGEEASRVFGRYVMACVYAAATTRELVPRSEWDCAYLLVDEAHLYVDEKKTQQMLSLIREYNLGITLSFQQMTGPDFNDNIRNAISTNTAIKYAAGIGALDMPMVSKDLQAEPEFIRGHHTTPTHVNFACFVRNISLHRPFTVTVETGNIERQKQMTPLELSLLDAAMASRLEEDEEEEMEAIEDDDLIFYQPVKRAAAPTLPRLEQPPEPKPTTPKKPSDDPDYF